MAMVNFLFALNGLAVVIGGIVELKRFFRKEDIV
jgi:hypothetical protein